MLIKRLLAEGAGFLRRLASSLWPRQLEHTAGPHSVVVSGHSGVHARVLLCGEERQRAGRGGRGCGGAQLHNLYIQQLPLKLNVIVLTILLPILFVTQGTRTAVAWG
jgi:hypothetical protein